jgi:uncharacterized protein (TIGR03083 family)
MATPENLAAIRSEGLRLLDYARRDPGRTVPHYPTWTMTDLVTHTAEVLARTTVIGETLPQERPASVALPEGRDPLDWYEATLAEMADALGSADPDAHVWTLIPLRKIGAWERRMVIEIGVHRWDAQQAFEDPDPLLPIVSELGFDEFNDMWLQRLGDVAPLRVNASDLGRSWTLGHGEPQSTASGTASDIYLRLMARPGAALPPEWEQAVDAIAAPAAKRS